MGSFRFRKFWVNGAAVRKDPLRHSACCFYRFDTLNERLPTTPALQGFSRQIPAAHKDGTDRT
jgi:hypothetical protein